MRYLSVCSGIEAATMAWHPLGWSPVAFSEIEKFPRAVLAHRYPTVANMGDMTQFKEWPDDDGIDLLVGGTPCQSFSVAGLRQGLADPRGSLMLAYAAIALRYKPRWLVWENVPGVLSSHRGRDFGTFLRALAECGYGFAYRVLDAQYVRVDGFGRAVPQRRRRVFVVGYLGDWRRPAEVLFEPEGLRGDSAPRREAGERVAPAISARPTGGGGGGLGTDFDLDGGLISSTGSVAHCLNAGAMGRIDYETETMIAHALRGEGFDASEDGTGRGTPIVPIAFSSKDYGNDAMEDCAPTLRSMTHSNSHANGGGQLAIAIQERAVAFQYRAGHHQSMNPDIVAPTLNKGQECPAVATQWAVRRLTPNECHRLQGFPDDFCNIPWRGKGHAPDGLQYKALGNSMAVNVMRWIGRRIERVERMNW